MPVVAEGQRNTRRRVCAAWALGTFVLLLAFVFAWSCVRSIEVRAGKYVLGFGVYTQGDFVFSRAGSYPAMTIPQGFTVWEWTADERCWVLRVGDCEYAVYTGPAALSG